MKKLSVLLLLSIGAITLAQATASQPAVPPTKANFTRIAAEVEKSLQEDDLKKFFPAAVDTQGGGGSGGFFENFGEDWSHTTGGGARRGAGGGADTTRSVVYQSRLLWLAAQAAMRYPGEAAVYTPYIAHGAKFLADKQWDKDKGGFWWSVDVAGRPVRADDKHAYGNAFAIYALAAAFQATHDPAYLELAKKGFAWFDKNAHDDAHGGYFEQLRADGSHTQVGGTVAGGDQLGARPGQKSMNAHIHILEALTGLLEVWPDDLLKKRTEEVYQISLTKITADPGYLHLFFAEDWTPQQNRDSYGHDIETAFLFAEAAKALGKPDDPACWTAGRSIVDHCLKVGYDAAGALANEGTVDGTGNIDRARVWWVQAESLNALLLMHERYGKDDRKYWDAFVKQWNYIKTYQIDHKNGGWYNTLDPDNTPLRSKIAKTDAWTEGYHQGRAMLSVTVRLGQLAAP